MKKNNQLNRGLTNRHLQMIALGGVIGTGLFYGSGDSINLAGPSVLISYLMGGIIIYLIIRMAGEMVVEEPIAGSFSHFAYKYWGEFPGFLSGWNYWFLYILISMAELSVIGGYIQFWFPSVPSWISTFSVLIIITLINLVNVKIYGEFEFYFAIIKVVAVIGMIIFGLYLLITNINTPSSTIKLSNLWMYNGFFPNGIKGMLLSLVIVMFSFGGTELITISAEETSNPRKTIPKAIKQVTWRIIIFYILAIAIMMIINPWNQIGDKKNSPFVIIFSNLGIDFAANILNIVVLTAAISVYNNGVYSNGRMLYSLAKQNNAPKIFSYLNKQRVPIIAILFSSFCTLAIIVINYMIPHGAFMQIMSLAVSAALITWGIIIITHIHFRKSNKNAYFKSIYYPYSNYLCLLFLTLIILLMCYISDKQIAVYLIPIWIGFIYLCFLIKKKITSKTDTVSK